MIIPIRCFTCSNLIANKYKKYLKKKEEKEEIVKIFEELKLKRYCCRRMLLTQVDLLNKLK
jgi:DNA-directed RNA polymerase subunit N (RpoN/RPB10)